MPLRALVLGIALGFAAAVAPSCSVGVHCRWSNCNGCCDENDVCQPGNLPAACGSQADRCVACDEPAVCDKGVCAAGPSVPDAGCTEANCAGCCDTQGQCRQGTTASLCGSMGSSCVACSTGQSCQQNQCAAVACTTCKDSAGQCQPGNQPSNCGAGGATCVVCPTGETCNNGVCGAAACTPQNCPAGCCDGVACTTPTDVKCGVGGGACTACGAGNVCNAGQCETPNDGGSMTQPCSAATCKGCCDEKGKCRGGDINPLACGTGGADCENCITKLKFFCVVGSCQ